MRILLDSKVLASDAFNRAATDSYAPTASTPALPKWGGPEIDAAEVSWAVQTSQPIGAKHVNHYDRGNADGVLRFSAHCRCGSLALASRIVACWPQDCPHSGPLVLEDEGGTSRSLGGAKVRNVRMRRTGVDVTAEYEIAYETNRSS